jgi:hypothetical protein
LKKTKGNRHGRRKPAGERALPLRNPARAFQRRDQTANSYPRLLTPA